VTRAPHAVLAVTLLAVLLTPAASAQQEFDLLITGARVMDGSGNPWRYADVGIVGNRVESGCVADLVILDLDALRDNAEFFDPHQHPGGIEHVLIGGRLHGR
jgi:N-acyl-D-aspartate/D-glutamate deacylase